jgi:hypothetical protein
MASRPAVWHATCRAGMSDGAARCEDKVMRDSANPTEGNGARIERRLRDCEVTERCSARVGDAQVRGSADTWEGGEHSDRANPIQETGSAG